MPRVTLGSFLGLLCALLFGSACLFVTGCGMGTSAAPNPVPLTVNGRVHGGQQAVSGAQIQLYVAGNAGNGSAASPLLNTTVTSGADGSFSITGDYSCPAPTSQVYLVAAQGNPGLASGTNNGALAMMAALGNCGNLSPSQFIVIDEVTTVAAAWTLAPFTKDIADIGSTSTNTTGIANAFLNAQLIADTTTGNVATLPSNLTTEPNKIYALADAVAACINSAGGAAGDGSACGILFSAATPAGGTAPTNTWDAAIDIVRNPGNNVAGVFSAVGPNPPFPTTLTQAPNDWTLSLTVTGGGISSPETLAADGQGNIWVADYGASPVVSAVSPQGTPLSSSGFAGSVGLSQDYGLAVDFSDNVWVTNGLNPVHGSRGSVVQIAGVSSGASLGTATTFSDTSINYPYALAADTDGSIYIANYYLSVAYNTTSLVKLTPATSPSGTSTFTPINAGNGLGFPVALAVDGSHGVWITGGNGDLSFTHIDNTGAVVFTSDCCGNTTSIALDQSNNVWIADGENSDAAGDGTNGAVTEITSTGTTEQDFITTAGITNPSHIAVDASNNVWISNLHTTSTTTPNNETFSELAGAGSATPGAAISPATGYGLDANLKQPYGLIVDPSGNVWISNTSGNSLVMFFGIATPTKTPQPPIPQAP